MTNNILAISFILIALITFIVIEVKSEKEEYWKQYVCFICGGLLWLGVELLVI